MIFVVEAEMSDGEKVEIEVMACDKYEAQVMAVQELASRLQPQPDVVQAA